MPLRDTVANLPPKARSAEKARAFVRHLPNGHTFERDGRTFTVHEWRFAAKTELLEAVVSSDGLAIANPLQFSNPPILVPDGTTRNEMARGGFVQVANMKEDLTAAAETFIAEAAVTSDQMVRDTAERKGVSLEEALTGDPTLTVYAEASDGYVVSRNSDYATARAGSTFTSGTSNQSTEIVGQGDFGGTYWLYESFYSFDTSSLGSGATVSAATFSLWMLDDNSTQDFTVEARLHDWGTDLASADWVAGDDLASKTLLASLNTSGMSTGVYSAFTSDSAFPSNVAKTGATRLFISDSRMRTSNAPTASSEWLNGYYADQTGTTNDPKLVVTYSLVTTVAIGQVTETNTAQAMTPMRTKAIGQATDTDTAQPMTSLRSAPIGLVTETDEALPMTPFQALQMNQVEEVDTVFPMTTRRTFTLGQVEETNEALEMVGRLIHEIGQIVELNIALPMVVYKPAWSFTPPALVDKPLTPPPGEAPPAATALLRHFGLGLASGKTLIKNADNTYTLVEYPSHDQLMAAKQQVWPDGEKRPVYYLGGHIYEVTSEERASLVAAGYGAYIGGGTV